jgi:hypothetical protein
MAVLEVLEVLDDATKTLDGMVTLEFNRVVEEEEELAVVVQIAVEVKAALAALAV